MEAFKVFTYQGLTTCTDVDTSWTIMSRAHNNVRHKKVVIERGMEKFIRKEVDYQEQPEAAGYRSPTWKVLRALQSLLAAEQLQGVSAITRKLRLRENPGGAPAAHGSRCWRERPGCATAADRG